MLSFDISLDIISNIIKDNTLSRLNYTISMTSNTGTFFEAVSLSIPIVFAVRYLLTYREFLNKIDDLEQPEKGKPWWRSNQRKYNRDKWECVRSSLFWSILTSWNLVYAQITAEIQISGWLVITTKYSPSILFPLIALLLILPIILFLVNNKIVRSLSKILAAMVFFIVFFSAVSMGIAAFFVYELKLIEFIV